MCGDRTHYIYLTLNCIIFLLCLWMYVACRDINWNATGGTRGWSSTASIAEYTQYQVDPSGMVGLSLISIIHQGILADPGRVRLA